MTLLTRRSLLAGLATLPLTRAAHAALRPYILSDEGTRIGFTFDLAGVAQSGTMPIRTADVQIDTGRLQNSQVTVTLDVSKARTRLPFARKY